MYILSMNRLILIIFLLFIPIICESQIIYTFNRWMNNNKVYRMNTSISIYDDIANITSECREINLQISRTIKNNTVDVYYFNENLNDIVLFYVNRSNNTICVEYKKRKKHKAVRYFNY